MHQQNISLNTLPQSLGRRRIAGCLAIITTGIFIVGLFSTITNLIPLSVLPFAWLALMLPLTILSTPFLPKVTFYAFLYLMLSLGSVLIYDPNALITLDFYRYDGNFLISFLPLLALPILPITKINVEKIVKVYVIIGILISLPPSIYQYVTEGYANGFFVATNAFGGFLISIISYLFAWLLTSNKKIFPLMLLFIAGMMLVLSSSRGSILGILAGIACFIAIQRGHRWFPVSLILMVVVTLSIILSITYPIYRNNIEGAYSFAVESADSTKEANMYIRAYENWPRGLHLFLSSPFLGTGVGSANDMPLVLLGESLFQMNLNDMRTYNSAHAHNTYLHVLGEQGIIGELLFLMMWVSVFKSIAKRRDQTFVKNGLLISFWALTFSSFTEHRIPSPSNVFPFMLIYLFYYMNNTANYPSPNRLRDNYSNVQRVNITHQL